MNLLTLIIILTVYSIIITATVALSIWTVGYLVIDKINKNPKYVPKNGDKDEALIVIAASLLGVIILNTILVLSLPTFTI